jgi:hypothetical protein
MLYVEEVLAINESAQRTSNQIKVRRTILVDSVFGIQLSQSVLRAA